MVSKSQKYVGSCSFVNFTHFSWSAWWKYDVDTGCTWAYTRGVSMTVQRSIVSLQSRSVDDPTVVSLLNIKSIELWLTAYLVIIASICLVMMVVFPLHRNLMFVPGFASIPHSNLTLVLSETVYNTWVVLLQVGGSEVSQVRT